MDPGGRPAATGCLLKDARDRSLQDLAPAAPRPPRRRPPVALPARPRPRRPAAAHPRRRPPPDEAQPFLRAPLSRLSPPHLLPGITEAADRITTAIADGKKVCVYGDYDVDGVTGSAILLQMLRQLGARCEIYLPHRLAEG